ncbi:MAG: tetratricopeptide repeat protein [Patescibacteria group bacterium]|nr:tetratricopeptide repeat protein [Patescibacteria group bacterium]
MNLKTFLRYSIITGLFLIPFVPLIVSSSMFFPFITGKNFTFRIIVEVVFALWLTLALVDKRYRPKSSWIAIAVTVFVVIVGIADIFSANPYKSFWSNYERMEGWITLIHLLAYFFVMSTVFTTEKIWNYFFNTSLAVSGIICFYSFFQLAGKIVINQGGDRLDATFGNSAYLAGYMLISIFLTLIMAWRYRKNNWAVATYGVLMVCELVVIYYTVTRGAILGLIGGIAITLAIFIFLDIFHFKLANKKLRYFAITFLFLIIVVVGGFWALRHKPYIINNPVLLRFSSISKSDAAPRMMIWGMAWSGFKESPKTILIGWGQESFNFVFNKYYVPKMWSQEQWFDRAHNVFFDWLISAGILGLLGYLSLFFLAFWHIWRYQKFDLIEKSLFTGLLVGYFFHNFFVFDNTISYILFFSLLAYFHTNSSKPNVFFEKMKEFSVSTTSQFILPLVIILTVILIYFIDWRPISANRLILQGLRDKQAGKADDILNDYNKIFSYNTMATPEALEQFSSVTLSVIGSDAVSNEVKQSFFNIAKTQFEKSISDYGNDVRKLLFYGTFLKSFGFYKESLPYIEKAHNLSPLKQTILFELGENYYQLGDLKNAFESFKTAYELAPEYPSAREYFLNVSGLVFTDILKKDPNNVNAHISLANVYAGLGDRNKALEEINIVIRLDPSYKAKGQELINLLTK